MSGVVRGFARDRSTGLDRPATEPCHPATTRPAHRRAIGAARVCADILTATPKARQRAAYATRDTAERISSRVARATRRRTARRRLFRRNLVLRLTADRALPIVIAVIVVAAASVSMAPATPVGAAEGAAAAQAELEAGRLVVGGKADTFSDLDDQGALDQPIFDAAVVDDGTLYKPVAVDTTIQTSAGMLRRYTVKEGDTLTSIASRFGVSMMTVWWANKLTSKEQLKAGRNLVIPPVSGLVVTVAAGDTLESIAKANKITVDQIVATNELSDTNLIVGQVLVLQGAKGAPMPTAKPVPTTKPGSGGGGGGGGGGGFVPVSGSWAWPVVGGGNYLSQGFKYGHYGLDIAASYGTPEVAPRAGQVIFAGWKDNGGGYQVWINAGNGVFTAMYHMSSTAVTAGQDVSKGQRVGRIGATGWASGNHVHYEVWMGRPWESGSYRVNPLRYY